ncbi:MAG: helix-turn-helix domain-containing protein [Candidatus Velamenicoccus archaeovorus]
MTNQGNLLTSTQAAKILKVSRQGLAYLVDKGKVKPERVVGRYKLFSEAEILAFKAKR